MTGPRPRHSICSTQVHGEVLSQAPKGELALQVTRCLVLGSNPVSRF